MHRTCRSRRICTPSTSSSRRAFWAAWLLESSYSGTFWYASPRVQVMPSRWLPTRYDSSHASRHYRFRRRGVRFAARLRSDVVADVGRHSTRRADCENLRKLCAGFSSKVDGFTPKCRLKSRASCSCELKPRKNATSLTLDAVINIRRAASSRRSRSQLWGVAPRCLRNRRCSCRSEMPSRAATCLALYLRATGTSLRFSAQSRCFILSQAPLECRVPSGSWAVAQRGRLIASASCDNV